MGVHPIVGDPVPAEIALEFELLIGELCRDAGKGVGGRPVARRLENPAEQDRDMIEDDRLAGFDLGNDPRHEIGVRRSEIEEIFNMRRRHYQIRSEEHTSELQSLMRISYAVLCLKTEKQKKQEK